MVKLDFDSIVYSICNRLPFIGKPIAKFYTDKAWFRRFTKFSVTTFLVYWCVRAPMIWGFTEMGVHYLISAFLSGIILSLVGFVISEGWIWK